LQWQTQREARWIRFVDGLTTASFAINGFAAHSSAQQFSRSMISQAIGELGTCSEQFTSLSFFHLED
jgi:hypothetical protein